MRTNTCSHNFFTRYCSRLISEKTEQFIKAKLTCYDIFLCFLIRNFFNSLMNITIFESIWCAYDAV